MSDNEFDELYQSGDLIWVDPDGREWVPAHIHATLKGEIADLELIIKQRGREVVSLMEKNTALKRKVELAIERIRTEDDPDIGKPWLVEHVLAILTAKEQE